MSLLSRSSWIRRSLLIQLLLLCSTAAVILTLHFVVHRAYRTRSQILEIRADVQVWLDAYLQFLLHSPDTPDTKYLVWSDAFAGIGDRVRGIVSSFYLALVLGRKFRIADPICELGLRPATFDWTQDADILHKAADHRVVFENGLDTELFKLAAGAYDEYRTITIRTNVAFWSTIMNSDRFDERLRRLNTTSGHWTGGHEDLLFTWAWAVIARPSDAVRRDLDALRQRLGLTGDYIAVHIRRGGHWGDDGRHNDLASFAACTRTIAAKVGPMPVYVASDDVQSRTLFSEMVPGPVRYDDLEPYHVAQSSKQSETGKLRAWTEFFLLSESACLVASRSGFSEWAVAMSRDPYSGARCWARYDQCSSEIVAESRHRLVSLPIWPDTYPSDSLYSCGV